MRVCHAVERFKRRFTDICQNNQSLMLDAGPIYDHTTSTNKCVVEVWKEIGTTLKPPMEGWYEGDLTLCLGVRVLLEL